MKPFKSIQSSLKWSGYLTRARNIVRDNPDNRDIYQVFLDVKKVLDESGIQFVVAGGIAYSMLVEARATNDVDIILMTKDVESACGALAESGYRFLHNTEFTDMPGWGVAKFDVDDEIDIDLIHSNNIFVEKVFEYSLLVKELSVLLLSLEAFIVLKKISYLNRMKSDNVHTRDKGKRDKLDYQSAIREKNWDTGILKEFSDLTLHADEIARDIKDILSGKDIS